MKSDTLYMNISSDEIVISDWEMNIFLSRNEVEKVLWPKLVQLFREWNYSNVIVLNWPWWFTNLRVGTLCINILNSLLDNQINIYDISKINLYEKAYKWWCLCSKWIIYIGQKRNVWLWDFEKLEKIWQYSFDELKEIINYPIFLDEVIDESYYPERLKVYSKINLSFDWNNITIKNWDSSIIFSVNDLKLEALKSISPNYMMEPSITLK